MNERRLELYRQYLDGELSPAAAQQLESELAKDAAARAEVEAYRRNMARLRAAKAPEPSADFASQVMRRLPAEPRRSWLQALVQPRTPDRLELYRQYLDGEIDLAGARELETLLARNGVARAELEAYRNTIHRLKAAETPEPPVDFVARVMRRLPAEPRRSWLRDTLLRPRLSLAAVTGLAMLLVAAWLPLRELRSRHVAQQVGPVAVSVPKAQPPSGVTPSRIMVRFVLPTKGAKHVSLAGDFNNWRTDDIVLEDEHGDGVFSATVQLPPGRHSYLFFVDGQWVQDPAATGSEPDGFGQRNSVLDL